MSAVAATTLLAALAACSSDGPAGNEAGGGPPQRPPAPVLVAEVTLGTLQDDVVAVGSLRSPRSATIAADASGIVTLLADLEGREIGRGQEIARIDSSEQAARVQVAEARLRNAQLSVERATPLVAEGVVPQQELDDAQTEFDTARGLLEEANTRVAKTQVRAPFAGVVGIQTAQQGQFVSAGDALIELTQIDPLELVFAVPEEQAATVRLGQTVDARVGRCGTPFTATVQARDPRIDPTSRTLSVQARVANGERLLLPGMSARVRLAVGESEPVLTVPREALVATGTGYQVWVVAADDTVSPRPVTAGRFLPEQVEIASGLSAGERVVAAGHQKIGPGATVSPQPWQPTLNPNLGRGLESGDCWSDDGTVREAEDSPGLVGGGRNANGPAETSP